MPLKIVNFRSCRACRSRRTRCVGNPPNPCARCVAQGLVCVHDERWNETKDKLRVERDDLKARQKAMDTILQALATNKNGEQALIALWRAEPVEQIAKKLKQRRPGNNAGDTETSGQRKEIIRAGPAQFAANREANAAVSDGPSSNSPSASTDVETRDFATNEDPSNRPLTGSYLSSPTDTRGSGRAGDRRSSSFANMVSTTTYSTGETSPQSNPSGSSCYSPAIDRNISRGAVDTPSFSDQEIAGPNTPVAQTQSNPSVKVEASVGEQWNENGLMVLPNAMTTKMVQLFFEKQYIPFPMIRQDLFWDDYHSNTHDEAYCCEALVQAISCLGALIWGGYGNGHHASVAARLYENATRLIETVKTAADIPTTHALGLMSLYQLGLGEYQKAQELAEKGVAKLHGLTRQAADIRGWQTSAAMQTLISVQATTLFATVSLARMIRLTVAHAEHSSSVRYGVRTTSLQDIHEGTDSQVEQLLQSNRPGDELSQRPTVILKLTDWMYNLVSRLQITAGDEIPQHVFDTYHACLHWYKVTLKQGDDVDPFIHMYYQFCLLTLLRPYCKGRSNNVSPAKVCMEAAEAILSLAPRCKDVPGPFVPCFVPLLLLAAGLVEEDTATALTSGDMASEAPAGGFSGGSQSAGEGCRGSFSQRAAEELMSLSGVYPSAGKAASELKKALSR